MQGENARLGESALLERLLGADERAITVVTANRRLAQALRAAFDARQAARGAKAWESADVLPLDAWLERTWEDLLYAEGAGSLPLLMSPAQEVALWDEVVAASPEAQGLLAPGATASRAREAWRLLHAWGLLERTRRAPTGEDARVFLEWAARFERLCTQRQLIDRARLVDALASRLAPRALEGTTVVLHGFDIVPPQLGEWLDRLSQEGVEVIASGPDPRGGSARCVSVARASDEHWAAARWARARLEAHPHARVGVVVPDLARSRDAVERAFTHVMEPAAALPGAAPAARSFDISLGRPLAEWPLACDALALLELMTGEVDFEVASRLVRSPFIAGAEREAGVRARLDARLRERCGARVDLAGLIRAVGSPDASAAPLLAQRLSQLAHGWRTHAHETLGASAWSSGWAHALRVAGFPGERPLDSHEYQTLQKWHEALASFGAIERVTGRMRARAALGRLGHLVRETVFQPEAGGAPVTIVGVLESAGLPFDHLWVAGMTDDAWPLPARPNPFVPVRVQREAGVPEADPVASLELDRRITAGWLDAAPEVVVSHARMRDDEELSVSPLFAHLEAATLADLAVADGATLAESVHALRATERVADGEAPAIVAPQHPGGTSLFQNQAACPFRAFARNRLASQMPGTPQPGLDAAQRGTLLHQVLATFWQATRTREALAGLDGRALQERLASAADDALARMRRRRAQSLEGRFAALERDRLVALARAWLDFELRRDDFEVIGTEAPVTVSFGGVSVEAKLDRIDLLASGTRAVLDYKTGVASLSSWLGARPDEPQLPMYALSVEGPVEALAFARVRPNELEFCGLSRREGLLPGVGTIGKSRSRNAKQYPGWDALVASWRRELEQLGSEFAAGVATVSPKRGNNTCRQCDQQVLCRIAEKTPQFDAGLGTEGARDE